MRKSEKFGLNRTRSNLPENVTFVRPNHENTEKLHLMVLREKAILIKTH